MKKIIKHTLIEDTLSFNNDGSLNDSTSKILNTTIIDSNSVTVLNTEQYQFTANQVQCGYLHFLKKQNNLYSLYSPNKTIKVSICGIVADGKFHSSQAGRIDRLSSITKNIVDLEAKLFKVYYDALKNMLIFSEI
ncbi:hypothetical protein [Clostridium botulinum]|uniref:hypothetical protein n=1 Tax=Clostridium botulinum TaxID=1491 RepID=UPI000773D4CA|nr:hypothetical protein [Clostridium botulinum]MBY6930658.1 hypothetical protein [Clostridium botulinum]NFG21848.1 hypothetical protein [Clostridium botulinum]NFO79755.1 hypothetical protein [Clostridium botulinum]